MVGDDWGDFRCEGEWPIVSLDEAKQMFDDALGDTVLGDSFEACTERMEQQLSQITQRLQHAIHKQKGSQQLEEWHDRIKQGSEKEILNAMKDLQIFSMSYLLGNNNIMCCDEIPWYFVFQHEEERQSFKVYVIAVLEVPAEDDGCWYTDGGTEVFTLAQVQKDIREDNGCRWG